MIGFPKGTRFRVILDGELQRARFHTWDQAQDYVERRQNDAASKRILDIIRPPGSMRGRASAFRLTQTDYEAFEQARAMVVDTRTPES